MSGDPIQVSEGLPAMAARLRQAQHIFVTPHWQPDGDCLGSALGITWGLRQMGKEVTVALDDRRPATFDYLPGYHELEFRVPGDQDLYLFVDGSDRTRFGRLYDLARQSGRPLAQVDHHATNDLFADVNWVDTSAASCGELIYQLLAKLEVKLDQTIATCLLTGILTDTLVFRTSSTTSQTLQAAVELTRAGASIPFIVDRVYNRRTFGSLHLMGYVLGQAKLQAPIIWSQVTQRELKSFGVNGSSSVGIINMLLAVDEAQIAVLFTEREDGNVEVGLRARIGYDVSGIAFGLGGGGHKQAAGAMIPGPLETARARVLAEIKKHLTPT